MVSDLPWLSSQVDNHQHYLPALLYAWPYAPKELTRTGSLSDYCLKIQNIVPRGTFRSPLQPYAAMWGVFWYVTHPFATARIMNMITNQGSVLHPYQWYLRFLPL